MQLTSPKELKTQLEKIWLRGDILRQAVTATPDLFPLRLTLKKPKSTELAENFQTVRQWIQALQQCPFIELEYKSVQHRILGQQNLPDKALVPNLEQVLAWLKQEQSYRTFQRLIQQSQTLPNISPWLEKHPHKALELAADWPQILAVVKWRQAHSQPNIYLRQMDIEGVHSKFIEQHKGVISELLTLVLPEHEYQTELTASRDFALRFGFLDKPERVRLRILDAALSPLPNSSLPDMQLDAKSFNELNLNGSTVFICENEINFLAFPEHPNALVIWGAGYGFSAFKEAQWLHQCQIYYWGDIDTHGFAILNQLRQTLPQAQSILMDKATLLAHRIHWGVESTPTNNTLALLSADEQQLYQELIEHTHQKNLRLEQERIGFDWVKRALKC